MSLLNRFSHLVFSATPPEPQHLLGLPASGPWGPCTASVVAVPGEQYSFYWAPTEPVIIVNPAVDLFTDALGGSLTGVAGISPVEVFPGVNHYKVQFKIPLLPARPEGYYRLMMQTSTGRVYSNRIWLRKADYEDTTALFSFRNRRAIGPLAYDLPELAGFRQVLRLKCQIGQPNTETQIEDYAEVTTGRRRVVETSVEHYVPVNCPLTDAFGHEGWRTLLAHKDLRMNGRPVSLKTGYSVEDTGKVSTGRFEVWDTDYAIINRC